MNLTDNPHIRATHDEGHSWCGVFIPLGDFSFKDAEHAAINGSTHGSLVPCMECIQIITKNLYIGYKL